MIPFFTRLRAIRSRRAALSALLALSATCPAVAAPVTTDHLEIELIAENTTVAVDTDNWLALRLKPEEGWHVYWRNPGDSGLPTGIDWQLPPGVSADALQWPFPQVSRIGDIVNYGYAEETLLPVALHVSATTQDDPIVIAGKAHWLVCKDVCIPGSADLSLSLPRAQGTTTPAADPDWRDAFANVRQHLPQPAPADWKVRFSAHDGDFSLSIQGEHFSSGGNIEFFPYASDLLNHSAPLRLIDDASSGLRMSQALGDKFTKAPDQVDGVLVVHDGEITKAWELHAAPGDVAVVPMSAARPANAPLAETPPRGGLPLILLFAVLGGLILNLMPCVFPMLSIKAISVLEARGKVPRRQRGNALAYTAGVLATFAGLAGVLLVLRGTGEAVGWGFQLQQPAFVAGLAYLFFAMGLSLSGVVEFGTRLMGVGQSLTTKGGYRGSFATGVLAVAVASPCTAPFMGTALGYALGQSPLIALGVFLALGFGLALPFLLLGFFPRLGALLPKPGAWMETFKQAMAFPLYLTVIGLLWVLGGLTDRNGMALALLGLTLLAFALWLWHRPGLLATILKILSVAGAAALLATPQIRLAGSTTPTVVTVGDAAAPHMPWSQEKLADLRAQGRTVFVNFTADWCITCKVNERTSLASSSVQRAFADGHVIWLEGDWTRNDPAITQMLTQFGRSGVPLYLVYVNGGEPRILPQILTPSTIIAALK